MSRTKRKRTLAGLTLLGCAALSLAAARTAPGDVVAPSVTLGPAVIANGVATLSGTVAGASSGASLTINGQPVGLNAAGQFATTVNLAGQSDLVLQVRNPATGDVVTTSIPLTSNLIGPGGVISPDVLSALERAAVSITKPLDGFKILDGNSISITGGVANPGELARLSVNGIDALSLLHPDGSFTIPIPGTAKEVTVTSTDRQGVAVTSSSPVTHVSTPAATGRSVSAARAFGVRIASIKYVAKGVRKTRRLRVIVTVKDRRGLLVHGAKVSIRGPAGRIARVGARPTNRVGRAGFVLRLRSRAFGHRLALVATAKTPSAKAKKRSSVRVPHLARSTAGRR